VKSAYTTVGNLDAINERIVSPSIQESVKAVTARYTAEELITKRQTVSTEIIQQLRDKLEKY
jgi:regulator of protease activity HflC (stomatin/prohibitin superfamily)